jgi:hypothetical protein
MVNRFIKKLGWFITINIILAVGVLIIIKLTEPSYEKTDESTEASFSAIPTNKQFDLVILGTSHAREFTRSGNKATVESILNTKLWNLSKGFGHGGLVSSIAAWDLFKQSKNTTKRLVYFIDPWIFYYSKWNEENFFLEDEPLKWDIFQNAFHNKASLSVLINYVKAKFKPSYFLNQPINNTRNYKQLDSINNMKAEKQMKIYYYEAINDKSFERYKELFKEFTLGLHKQGIELVIIIPPTLLNKEPGFDRVWNFLSTIKNIKLYDHSQAVRDPKLYYDISHLNSTGIEYYTNNYLKAVLAN